MNVDATQIIMGAFLLIGGAITAYVTRRGNHETAKSQRDANVLAERVQGFEEIESALVRAREEIAEQRRYRSEDQVRHDTELQRERAVSQHERDRVAALVRREHVAAETILLLKRAVHDEAMKAAADLAIQSMVADADEDTR